MKQSFRYRFYPNQQQRLQLAKEFGCARFVYNWALSLKKETWEKEKRQIGIKECSKLLTAMRHSEPTAWLGEATRIVTQQSLRHLDIALGRFFRKQSAFPTFKKRSGHQCITYCSHSFRIKESIVSLNKLGILDVTWSRPLIGKPTSIAVSRNQAGQ